jgi:AcrR family transcriptional regulator
LICAGWLPRGRLPDKKAAMFHRARQPEQKAERRQAILTAAAALFDAEGPQGAGLNAIAAKAGFTKSNVYRYFESREAVLLSLFMDEVDAVTASLEARLAALPVGDLPVLAEAITDEVLARPRFGPMLSIIFSVLEQNLSVETIVDFKRWMGGQGGRMALALHRVLPDAPITVCGEAWTLMSLNIAALWPFTHPSPNAAKVYDLEEFAALRGEPRRDIGRALLVILKGTAAG